MSHRVRGDRLDRVPVFHDHPVGQAEQVAGPEILTCIVETGKNRNKIALGDQIIGAPS